MSKKELRKKYIDIRNNIINRDSKDESIFNNVINDKDYIAAKTIGLYYSINSEVDTIKLINYSLMSNKTVLLPKVEKDIINFYTVEDIDALKKGSFGIHEPFNGIVYYKNKIDLIIVPLVCFDKALYRLGYGKGYYDKYLDGYNGKTIGIAYDEEYTENIPIEETDKKLMKIITDKKIYL